MQNLLNPPPADVALPKTIRDLLTELVAARGRAGQASSTHAWLGRTAPQDDKEAAEADRQHAIEAARTGDKGSLTPNADALATRRAEAADAAERTAREVEALEADARDAIDAHRDSGAPAAATEKAIAALAPAADGLRAAVTTLAQARALEQWFAGGPYRAEATIDVQALAPATSTTIGPAVLRVPPCDVFAAIDAIAHFTD